MGTGEGQVVPPGHGGKSESPGATSRGGTTVEPGDEGRKGVQYFRITPTTTPWMRTSRSWKRIGCIVALAGWSRTQPPASR